MEALKRAYAEMILNTTKEAAARVLQAELRARRMELEMNSTKQEAAGLLLRLKQMIDSKVSLFVFNRLVALAVNYTSRFAFGIHLCSFR